MKKRKNFCLLALLWLLLSQLFIISCSEDDPSADGKGRPLPEGKYPLRLTVGMEGMVTRAGGMDEWVEDEQIGVRIGGDGEVGKYKITDEGDSKFSAVPADEGDPLYWRNTSQATVTAWYPYEEPEELDLTDQSTIGFEPIDFLKAECQGASYSSPVELEFTHQMAKVKYTLTNDADISDEAWEAAEVSFYGYTQVSFKEGVLTGSDEGWITATSEKDGETWLVPGLDIEGQEFICVSVTIDGKPSEFFYTPKDGADNLEPGKIYTYNIKVKRDKIEVTVEAPVPWGGGSDINGDNKQEVTHHILTLDYATGAITDIKVMDEKGQEISLSNNIYKLPPIMTNFTISYTPKDLTKSLVPTFGLCRMNRTWVADERKYKTNLTNVISDITLSLQEYVSVGDYYYSDGTWGPEETSSNLDATYIGVVFHSGIGPDDDIKHYGENVKEILGYVVAKTNLPGDPYYGDAQTNSNTSWGGSLPRDESSQQLGPFDVPELENYSGYSSGFNGISYDGYARNKIIRENYLTKQEKYEFPAFSACLKYEPNMTNSNNSGWYIPSAAMLRDILPVKDKVGLDGNLMSCTEDIFATTGVVGFYYGRSPEYTGRTKNDYSTPARAVLTFFSLNTD